MGNALRVCAAGDCWEVVAEEFSKDVAVARGKTLAYRFVDSVGIRSSHPPN
jgi:hypothetical protein